MNDSEPVEPQTLRYREVTFEDDDGREARGYVTQAYADHRGTHVTIKTSRGSARRDLLGKCMLELAASKVDTHLNIGPKFLIIHPTRAQPAPA